MRELERGKSNRDIAVNLKISAKTVKFYMSNIMQKLGVNNRVAAALAFQKSDATPSAARGNESRH